MTISPSEDNTLADIPSYGTSQDSVVLNPENSGFQSQSPALISCPTPPNTLVGSFNESDAYSPASQVSKRAVKGGSPIVVDFAYKEENLKALPGASTFKSESSRYATDYFTNPVAPEPLRILNGVQIESLVLEKPNLKLDTSLLEGTEALSHPQIAEWNNMVANHPVVQSQNFSIPPPYRASIKNANNKAERIPLNDSTPPAPIRRYFNEATPIRLKSLTRASNPYAAGGLVRDTTYYLRRKEKYPKTPRLEQVESSSCSPRAEQSTRVVSPVGIEQVPRPVQITPVSQGEDPLRSIPRNISPASAKPAKRERVKGVLKTWVDRIRGKLGIARPVNMIDPNDI